MNSSSFKLTLVLLTLCAFAQSQAFAADFAHETIAAKIPSTQPAQIITKADAPVFQSEKVGPSQKLTFTFSVPASIQDGWQSCLRTTGNAAQAVGKNATALGKWLDDGFKKIDEGSRPAQVYVSPVVSSASKYCSKFHPTYFQDGRIKTVAHR